MLKKKNNSEYEIDRELTGKFAIEKNAEYQERIAELEEENQKLKETLNKIKEAWIEHEKDVDSYYKKWQNSYGDLDQIIMNR